MEPTTEKFDLWAVVELFGHNKIAGHCTEQNIAGANMLRVDVPETKANPPFTRFLGAAAIYAINPVTMEVAMAYAGRLQVQPINSYDVAEVVRKQQALLALETNGADIPFPDNNESSGYPDDDNEL